MNVEWRTPSRLNLINLVHIRDRLSLGNFSRLGLDRAGSRKSAAEVFVLLRGGSEVVSLFFLWLEGLAHRWNNKNSESTSNPCPACRTTIENPSPVTAGTVQIYGGQHVTVTPDR